MPEIIGLHVAGTGDVGFSNVITSEMVAAALETLEGTRQPDKREPHPQMKIFHRESGARIQPEPIVSFREDEVFQDFTIVDGVAVPDGTIKEVFDRSLTDSTRLLGKTRLVTGSPIISNLVPTIFQSMQHLIGVTMKKKPAHLKPFRDSTGSIVDPMVKARDGYSVPCPLFDQFVICRIAKRFAKWVASSSMDEPRFRPWTWIQVFTGIPGDDFGKPMDRTTSAGWPWSMFGSRKGGKKSFLGTGETYDLDSSMCKHLIAELERKENQLDVNELPREVFFDFLKDEALSEEKVDLGKSRLVSCAPLSLTCLIRKYFMPFMKWFFENRIRNYMAPGVNPYGKDWDRIANKIAEIIKGKPGVWAGDYKGWDKSMNSKVMLALWPFFEEFMSSYTDREKRISKNLLLLIMNTFHLASGVPKPPPSDGKKPTEDSGDDLYMWCGSMSSGVALTTFGNSILNNIVILASIFDKGLPSIPKVPGESHEIVVNELVDQFMESIRKCCYICTFGDDNIIAIDTDVLKITPQDIVDGVLKYGFTLTDESKSGTIGGWRSIPDITFLKRGFAYDKHLRRWIAPLELDSILQSFFWKSKKVPDEQWPETVYTHLCELSLHSPAIFNKYFPKYIGVLKDKFRYHPPEEDHTMIRRGVLRRTQFY